MPTPSKNTMRKLSEIVADLQPSLRKVADFILRHPFESRDP